MGCGRAEGTPKVAVAVRGAHLTGVCWTAGTGKQGWWGQRGRWLSLALCLGTMLPPNLGRARPPPQPPRVLPSPGPLSGSQDRRQPLTTHPSCGSQERRELAKPCQARARPATEAQILQLAACPATQRRQESQVSLACVGPVGCVGLEVTQWRWAGPGALEARAVGAGLLSGFRGRWASVTASPEDPEPRASRGGERLGH